MAAAPPHFSTVAPTITIYKMLFPYVSYMDGVVVPFGTWNDVALVGLRIFVSEPISA